MLIFMADDLERFVASLAIPAERKAVVLAELADHAACAAEAAVRAGRDPQAAREAALGDLEALRGSLEAIEPGFRVTVRGAVARGALAAVLVAIALDQGGAIMRGGLGALVAIALAGSLAPPRILSLLRAELRAPRVRGWLGDSGGIPIGPALTYALIVMYAPFVIWIALIVVRALTGNLALEVPWSAFAVMTAGYLVFLVEGLRARTSAAG
jgi:hypothetical protein